ncbi:MAG: triose-phosphate isomerase [Clostridiales bacterium]|nr:triose-phosphate isomerase [Clostridiales bacterium]
MKNKFIAGNWKMNKTIADTKAFINDIIPLVAGANNRVALCVPFTDLATAVELTKGTNVAIGAQNVHWAESGAFTGEISVNMLKELGVEYVVIGHSERRQYFGETDATVLKRTLAALNGGLKPIVCIGETLAEREGGLMEEVLKRQTLEGLADVSAEQMADVVIAYEPVWAIGTGKTATNQEANDAIGYIRGILAEKYGDEVAQNVFIQYGGSMNEKNAADLLSMPQIDGGLIGGASLVPEKFQAIVKAK